jgi:hypothetical protein
MAKARQASPYARRVWRATEPVFAELQRFGRMQCSLAEAAAAMGSTEPELTAFLDRCDIARRAFEMGRANGLADLRTNQLAMAAKSVPMAMQLGKTYLGQDQRRENDDASRSDQASAQAGDQTDEQAAKAERAAAADRIRAKLAAIFVAESEAAALQGAERGEG